MLHVFSRLDSFESWKVRNSNTLDEGPTPFTLPLDGLPVSPDIRVVRDFCENSRKKSELSKHFNCVDKITFCQTNIFIKFVLKCVELYDKIPPSV